MRTLSELSNQLEALEAVSLDNPDQLFAISYLRGHTDLLLAKNEQADESDLKEALRQGFKVDSMSDQDRSLIIDLLNTETRHQ